MNALRSSTGRSHTSFASGSTRVTRATELKNLLFHDDDESAERVEAMLQYFTRKVDTCKLQDKKAKREAQEHCYVTGAWLMGFLGKSCSGCGDALTYERGKSNLTAQRKGNTVGHQLRKVVPLCCWCNFHYLTGSKPLAVRGLTVTVAPPFMEG